MSLLKSSIPFQVEAYHMGTHNKMAPSRQEQERLRLLCLVEQQKRVQNRKWCAIAVQE